MVHVIQLLVVETCVTVRIHRCLNKEPTFVPYGKYVRTDIIRFGSFILLSSDYRFLEHSLLRVEHLLTINHVVVHNLDQSPFVLPYTQSPTVYTATYVACYPATL